MSTGAALEGAVLLSGILQDIFNDDNGIEVIQAQVLTDPRIEIKLHIDSSKGRTAFIKLMERLGRVIDTAFGWDTTFFGPMRDPLASFSTEMEVPDVGYTDSTVERSTRWVRLTIWGAAGR